MVNVSNFCLDEVKAEALQVRSEYPAKIGITLPVDWKP